MMRRLLIPLLATGLLAPVTLLAQQAGTHSDRYSTVQVSHDTIVSADGQKVLEERFTLIQFADDPESPFHELTGHCWGAVIFAGPETAAAAGGVCHMMDGEGSGYFSSWVWEESETEACPIRCGSYQDFNGYGRFAGMSGSGRWNLTALLPGPAVTGRHVGTYAWK